MSRQVLIHNESGKGITLEFMAECAGVNALALGHVVRELRNVLTPDELERHIDRARGRKPPKGARDGMLRPGGPMS